MKVIGTNSTYLSRWVTLHERSVVDQPNEAPAIFHSLGLDDYVTAVAVSDENEIIVVRQFRPALNAYSLELPGGLLETDESPKEAVLRELHEETGFYNPSAVFELGTFSPDPGRLENLLWGYFVCGVSQDSNWSPEKGVQKLTYSKDSFFEMIEAGDFNNAQHLALVGLSRIRGVI